MPPLANNKALSLGNVTVKPGGNLERQCRRQHQSGRPQTASGHQTAPPAFNRQQRRPSNISNRRQCPSMAPRSLWPTTGANDVMLGLQRSAGPGAAAQNRQRQTSPSPPHRRPGNNHPGRQCRPGRRLGTASFNAAQWRPINLGNGQRLQPAPSRSSPIARPPMSACANNKALSLGQRHRQHGNLSVQLPARQHQPGPANTVLNVRQRHQRLQRPPTALYHAGAPPPTSSTGAVPVSLAKHRKRPAVRPDRLQTGSFAAWQTIAHRPPGPIWTVATTTR